MVKIISIACLGYEFLGMALITMTYNLTKGIGYTKTVFVVTLWAWNLGTAHYNMAITLGACIYASDSFSTFVKNAKQFVPLLLVQFTGTLFGVYLTFLASKVSWFGDNTKVIMPVV